MTRSLMDCMRRTIVAGNDANVFCVFEFSFVLGSLGTLTYCSQRRMCVCNVHDCEFRMSLCDESY